MKHADASRLSGVLIKVDLPDNSNDRFQALPLLGLC